MNEWTSAARSLVEQYLNRHRARFAASGAEADEVIADLRRHVESEAAASGLTIVTENDVRRILARVDPELLDEPRGTDSPATFPQVPVNPLPAPAPDKRLSTNAQVWLWLFGVLLPAFTLVFELVTNACAGDIFDPAPTWLHALLIALVPIAQATVLVWLRKPDRPIPGWLWWIQTAAVGVAGAYALLFLPMFPFALIGIFFLIGFLPLAPILAWTCGLVLSRALKKQALRTTTALPPHRWLGLVGAWLLLLAPTLPGVLTRFWVETAVQGTEAESIAAIQRLRQFGSNDALLRACYGQARDLWSEMGILKYSSASREQVQAIYYRVTGQPFNAVKPPLSNVRGNGAAVLRDFEWDNAVGGEAVAGHVSGLSLHSSRLDAMGNADDGWGYTEWTLEFRNDHQWQQREARAEIQMPPGGVVSRVTLWVNGEEREAAFAGRGEVRLAYQQVAVVQRRDPILVTTSGPDRVLMQCFPVPANGGTMKVRLGITAPLAPLTPGEIAFVWPRFAERNFAIRDELRHHAWLEAQQPAVVQPPGWTLDAGRSNALHAAISERSGPGAFPVIRLKRTSATETSAWVRDERAGSSAWVRQRLTTNVSASPPGRLALVVDGGRGGFVWPRALQEALEQAGGRGEISIWIAQDQVVEAYRGAGGLPLTEAAEQFTRQMRDFGGGHDQVPALEAAWNWAGEKRGGTVVWIHGPQPVLVGDFHAIRQRLERTLAGGTKLLDFQAGLGPNKPAKELADTAAYEMVPRLGTLTYDLIRVLREHTGTGPSPHWTRERVETDPGTAVTASRHLVRLWAADEIGRLRSAKQIDPAIKLAGTWQLVTPVSGAVVLENKQQFTQAGLTAADPLTTPSVVPEPETWALFGVGAVLLWLCSRRSRKPKSAIP